MATKDVDLVKGRLDIVEFLRSYLTLTPAGKNLKALCPFHQEKTPSFIVSPERRTWHCFGCGEGGDVISFVMKYEHLEFPEALRMLAERAGVELKTVNPQAEREFGILYSLHDAAKAFYRAELKKAPRALEYLAGRTLTSETIDEFEIGFAPASSAGPGQGEALTLHLVKQGFAIEDVVRAGLSAKTTAGLHRDRFQNRIMFPIVNHIGKTVAFTGRTIPGGAPKPNDPPAGGEPPKYLNSPETPIFIKSRILFGLNKSKMEIAKTRTAVLMEGQMDLILAWQAGVRNAVAVSGTGLSREHLERLRRIADSVLMSFDRDDAGAKALERALDILSAYDFHLKAADLSPYKDPGEACEKDPSFLAAALTRARPAFEVLIEQSVTDGLDVPGRKRAVAGILHKVKRLRSAAERDAWLKALARQSGISEISLVNELNELEGEPLREEGGDAVYVPSPPQRVERIAARLITLSFTNPEFPAIVRANQEFFPEPYRTAIDKPELLAGGLAEMQASVVMGSDPKSIAKEFNDLVRELKIEHFTLRQSELRRRVREAEQGGDETAAAAAKRDFHEVSQTLNQLKTSR